MLAFAFFCILIQGCWATPYQCNYYNKNYCKSGVCESKIISCKKEDTQCFSVWHNKTGTVQLVRQGCLLNGDTCSEGPECIGRLHLRGVLFCCCRGNFCNENFTSVEITPVSTYTTKPPVTTALVINTTRIEIEPTKTHRPLNTLLYSIVPVCGFAVILVFAFFVYYRHKTPSLGRGAITVDEELHMCVPPSPDLIGHLPNVQFIEILSRGQYCTVWKANYLKETVAVKVISVHEKASWLAERDFYTNCNLNHDNILKFITAEIQIECQLEYWLITEYHEKGSLADYLKQNVISWNDFCKVTASVASGLAYLHSEMYRDKPCIAHRDVKSKNILVKKDLSCCIADFGLATKFEAGNTPGDTHGQVGTKRYMAPEVLEGAITFTRDAFLRIDMYALALVMWEILSRCTAASGPVGDYRLPFEDEVGLHPSLEDMQQAVSQKKIRPRIRDDWRLHTGMALVCQTVEECWDQDAEARLTAECVYERLSQFFGYSYNSAPEHCSAVTPLINNTGRPCLESSV